MNPNPANLMSTPSATPQQPHQKGGGIKAWKVTNESGEPTSLIVFAGTRGDAKYLAHHHDGFACEWIDLSAKRFPEADKYGQGRKSAIIGWQGDDLRIYRDLGWMMHEAESCDSCGLFEAESIPESILAPHGDYDHLCLACRNADKPKEAA